MNDVELHELLARERDFDDIPEGASRRVLEAVGARIGAPDGGGGGGTEGGTPTAPPAGAARIDTKHTAASTASTWLGRAAYLAVGAVAGASGHAVLSTPQNAAPSPHTVFDAPTPVVPETSASTSDVRTNTAPDAGSELHSVQTARIPSPRIAPSRSPDLASERADLDIARAALAHGRTEACLDGLMHHARTYPGGAFSEERDSLWISALVAAGRVDEASARAKRFRARYPNSLFGPAIDRAVGAP